MFSILNVCGDYILGNILDIIKRTIDLLGIIVPIILIIGGTINIVRGVLNPEDKKVVKNTINSFLSAIIVFFLPFIINTTMAIIDLANDPGKNDVGIIEGNEKEVFSVSACWNNIKTTDVTAKPRYQSTLEAINATLDEEQQNSDYSTTYKRFADDLIKLIEEERKNQSSNSESTNNDSTSNKSSTNISNQTYKKVVIIGDSRFVWLSTYGPKDSRVKYYAKGSEGLAYLKQQINNIKAEDSSDAAFVINLGVNDLINDVTTTANDYISYINDMAKNMKGKIYFLSVNPIIEDKAKSYGYNISWANNTNVNNFNTKLKNGLDSSITFLDSNSYLKANGFTAPDGIHYDAQTYIKIRTFILDNVKLA